MQITTLSYQYKPKENINGDDRAKLYYRRVLTTEANPQKKPKQRQSLRSKLSRHSNGVLPPIGSAERRSSLRINGSVLTSSKLGKTTANSFYHQSRSTSRQSNKSENLHGRSRSESPGGALRPASKMIRAKFGHPITLRSPDFYRPNKSETELRLREDSFVNDSIRSAHQKSRTAIIPHYEALNDPNLRRFFQSPIVLDIVRKTLNVDPTYSYKQDERSSKLSKIKSRSLSNDLLDNENNDFRRITSKGSSGYAKLNGYHCIPSYSRFRHHHRPSSIIDPITSTPPPGNTTNSRLNHSTQDKYRASTNTSVTSIPIIIRNQLHKQERKKKTHKHEKPKQLKPIATASPLRHPVRNSVEATTSNTNLSSTAKTNGNAPEQKNEFAVTSNVTQD